MLNDIRGSMVVPSRVSATFMFLAVSRPVLYNATSAVTLACE